MATIKEDCELDKCIDHTRISLSLRSLGLVVYLPAGLLVLVFRLCLIPQVLLLMLVVPEGTIKRFLLWIFFAVLGLVVVNKNFERRSRTARMLVANRVSHIDYIPLQVAMDCTTSSVEGLKPLFSMLFYHHTFASSDTTEISNKLKKIPEFDDEASIPDSVAVPFVAQPEPQPTNGLGGVLKFSMWPFTVEPIVQPLAVSSWRPLDIKLTTVDSSEITDLLWTLYCPFTVFTFQMLPIVESREDITPEQFAKKTQDNISTCLGISSTQKTSEDIQKWKDGIKHKEGRSQARINRTSGPIISESDFSKVRASSEVERMVQQVLAVLPDAPQYAIRRDLMETRSVDATLTKFLDGTMEVNGRAETPQTTTTRQSFSMQDCHTIFNNRKNQMIEEARRQYLMKHGRTK